MTTQIVVVGALIAFAGACRGAESFILASPEKTATVVVRADAEAKALATWVWNTLEFARYPMRFAEQTKRNSTIRQVIWDLTGRKVPVRGAKWKFTPNRAPYGFKLSKKPDFPANETREWPRKLKVAEVELGDLEPDTVYYWWTDDNMHRHEQGYFMTEGGGSGGALAPAGERDEKSPDSDGWIPAN